MANLPASLVGCQHAPACLISLRSHVGSANLALCRMQRSITQLVIPAVTSSKCHLCIDSHATFDHTTCHAFVYSSRICSSVTDFDLQNKTCKCRGRAFCLCQAVQQMPQDREMSPVLQQLHQPLLPTLQVQHKAQSTPGTMLLH